MVEVSGLTKRYGEFTALDGVSFQVRAGECFALLGPNGSGKTTTLRCLAGLAIPSAGSVRVNGISPFENGRQAKALLSYLPQRVAFHESLTARETLAFYCRLRGLPVERACAVLDQLDLGALRDRAVGGFSGGMLQRLGIAVALLPDAPLLLFDEPAVGLDPAGAIRFRALLRSLSRAGKTILFSSHVLGDVEFLADRVAVLVSGRLVAVEAAERISNGFGAAARLRICIHNPEPRFVDIALRTGAAEARLSHDMLTVSCAPAMRLPLLEALRSEGAGIDRFYTEEPSLEEVYLRYVNESASFPRGDGPGRLREPPAAAG